MALQEAVDIDGKTRSLSEFAGKVTLVVNVASACGYTDENYKGGYGGVVVQRTWGPLTRTRKGSCRAMHTAVEWCCTPGTAPLNRTIEGSAMHTYA